jgi:WD40 repeat protein/serine/threonine protein kinase
MSKPDDQTPPHQPVKKPFDPNVDQILPEGAFDKTLPEDEGLAVQDEASTMMGDTPDAPERDESTAIEPAPAAGGWKPNSDEFGKSTAEDLLSPNDAEELSTMAGTDPDQDVSDASTMVAHDEGAAADDEFGKTTATELVNPPQFDESATQVGDEVDAATPDDATMMGLDDATDEDAFLKTIPDRVLAQLDEDDFATKTMSMDDPLADADATFSEEDFGKTMPASALGGQARDDFADRTMMMDDAEGALSAEDLEKTVPEGALAPTTPEAATMLEDGSGTSDQDDGFGKTVQADAFSKTMAAEDVVDSEKTNAGDTAPEQFDGKTIVGADSAVEGQVSMSAKTIADPNLHRLAESVVSSRATRAGGRTSIDGTEVLGANLVEGIDQDSLNVAMRSIGGMQYGVIPRVDFKLVKQLGEGGMGVVYVAKQQSLGREVVFKTLKPIPESQASKMKGSGTINSVIKHRTDMFLSEAVVTADLFHPNIVPIYELARAPDGSLFYTMKWVRGDGWHKRIKEMTLEENLEVLMKVCDAVGFAHSRQIVNRDLKPENVMLGGYGETIVLDWGLALPFGEAKDRLKLATTAGLASGTPAYMPPELITGPITIVGPACDIYLLGAMLFEVITGVPPHDFSSSPSKGTVSKGAKMAEIRRVVIENIIRDTGVTGELMDIACKAMATKIEDRYRTAAELQDAIRDYQRHAASRTLVDRAKELTFVPPPVTVESKPSSDAPIIGYANYQDAVALYKESLREWPGNHNAREGLSETQKDFAELALTKGDLDLGLSVLDTNAAAHAETRAKLLKAREDREGRARLLKTLKWTAVALLIGFAGISAFAAKGQFDLAALEVKRKEAVDATDKANADRLIAIEERKEAKKAADAAMIAKEEADTAKNDALVAAEKAKKDKERADEMALVAKKLADDAELKANQAEDKATKADQKAIAAAKKADDAAVAQAKAEKLKDKADEDAKAALIAKMKADSDRRQAQYQRGLADAERKFYEGDYCETLLRLTKLKKDFEELCKEEWELLNNAASAPKSAALSKPVESISLSQDGTRLVAGDTSGQIIVWPIDRSGNILYDQPIRGDLHLQAKLRVVVLSPDGHQVAAAGEEGRIRIWSLASGDEQKAPIELTDTLSADAINALKFSRDGKRLASGGDDRSVRLWSIDEQRVLVKDQVLYPVQCVDWSTDGVWLVAGTSGPENASGVAYSWKVQKRQDELTLTRTRLFQTVPDAKEKTKQNRGVLAIALTNDGKYAVSNGPAADLYLWQVDPPLPADKKSQEPADPKSQTLGKWPLYVKNEPSTTRRLGPHSNRVERVRSLAFSADGQRLFAAGDDNAISIWDRTAGESLPQFTRRMALIQGHGGSVRGCLPLPQSPDLFVSGSYDQRVHLWDLKKYFKTREEFERPKSPSPPPAAFQPRESDVAAVVGACQSEASTCGADAHASPDNDVAAAEPTCSTPEASELVLASFPLSKQDEAQKDATPKATPPAILTSSKAVRIAAGFNRDNERIGHSDSVFSAVFSRDGKRVISASRDQTARAWSTETGLPIVSVTGKHPVFDDEDDNQFREGHEYDLFTMRFFPDGQKLLTSGFDGAMRVWDSRIGDQNSFGRELAVLPNTSMYGVVEISRDGQWILTAGRGSGSKGYSARSRGMTAANDEPLALLWSTQELFDPDRRWPKPTLKLNQKHRYRVTAVAISPDQGSTRLLTGDREGQIVLWDARTGQVVGQPQRPHRGEIVKLEFLKDGSRLLTAGVDRSVRLWNVVKSDSEFTLEKLAEFKQDAMIANLAVSPLGDRFLSVTTRREKQDQNDKTELLLTKTAFWNIDTGEERVLSLPTRASAAGMRTNRERERDRPPFPAWAPNGIQALITTSEGITTPKGLTTSEGMIHFFDSQAIEITDSLRVDNDEPSGAGYRAEPYAAMLVPDPDRVNPPHLVTQTSNAAFLWRLNAGKGGEQVSSFRPQGPVFSAGYSADGKYVVTGGRSVRIFDGNEAHKATYGRPLFKLEHPHEGIVTSVEFTPAENSFRFLTTGFDGTAKIWAWDPKGSQVTGPLHTLGRLPVPVRFGTWSADGSRVLTVGDDAIPRVWHLAPEGELKPGTELTPIELPFPKNGADAPPNEQNRKFHLLCGAFSWDGNFVAVGGRDADTGESIGWIWSLTPANVNPAAPQQSATIRGHGLGGIKSVAFLPNDDRVITGGDDGTARLWDWRKDSIADNAGQIVEADFLVSLVRKTEDFQRTTHRGAVNSVRVTPNGQIVTASADGTVLIWPK